MINYTQPTKEDLKNKGDHGSEARHLSRTGYEMDGDHLKQSPFASLNPSEYPES